MSRAARKENEVTQDLKRENAALRREVKRLRKELLKLGASQEAEPQEPAVVPKKPRGPVCLHCGPKQGTPVTFITPSGKQVVTCLNCHERIVV
jgi:hypothetical protein